MKKTLRLFSALVLAVVMISLVFSFSAGADVLDENRALRDDRYGKLLDLQKQYTGTGVNTYIAKYADLLDGMRDENLQKEDAAEKINLYYEQGVAAAKIANIYYSYINDTRLAGDKDDVSAVEAVHQQIQSDKIEWAVSADSLRESVGLSYSNGGLCAKMYVTVFEKMLDNLIIESEDPDKNDSDEVRGKIAAAKSDIKYSVTEPTLPDEYEAIYNRAVQEAQVRRNKDIAIRQLENIFAILYPNGSVSDNDAVLAAKNFINSDSTTTPAQMNEYLKSAVNSLIEDKNDNNKYVDAYVDSLTEAVKTAVGDANETGKVAELAEIFKEYPLDIEKAKTKDVIAKNIESRKYGKDGAMAALESEYNADNGIIDGCKNTDELAFEAERASRRADLYGEYLDTVDNIKKYGEYPDILSDTAKEYSAYDKEIADKTRGDSEACKKAYDECVDEFEKLIVSAEVKKYNDDNTDVLSRSPSSVTVADKENVLAAISGIKNLTPEAVEILKNNGTVDKLAEQYKAITKSEIDGFLGDSTDKRKLKAADLKAKADKLTVNGDANALDKLVADADRLVDKAEETDKIYDRYDDVLKAEDYSGFSAADKDGIDNIANTAVNNVLNAADGADVSSVADRAVVDLSRAEAKAKINAKASERDDLAPEIKEAVDKIASDAKNAIDSETDISVMPKIAENAEFDIQKAFDINDMNKKAADAKDTVDGLKFLGDTEKETEKEKISNLAKALEGGLDSAKTDEERKKAVSDFETKLNEIISGAQAADAEAKAKAQKNAKDELEDKHGETVSAINGLNFISEAEKEKLINDANSALENAKQNMDNAVTPDELEAEKNKGIEDLNKIKSDALSKDSENEQALKTLAGNDIDRLYSDLIEEINALKYLDTDAKNALKSEAKAEYDKYKAAIEAAKTPRDVEEEKNNTENEFTAIDADANAKELATAKASAISDMNAKKKDSAAKLSGFKYLSHGQKKSFENKLDSIVTEGEKKIAYSESVEAVETERDAVLAAMRALDLEAKELDDKEFVASLMPWIIALTVIGVIEIIAIIALVGANKKAAAAAFAPLAGFSVTPVTAKVVTVVLALADAIMAVVIIYLIIMLIRARRSAQTEDEAPEEESKDLSAVFVEPEPETEPEPEPVVIPEPVESITVEEADKLMSDEDAIKLEQTEEVNEDEEPKEIYTGKKKAEINIDTISRNFEAGDRVSLNSLKEKKLVSKDAGAVKVLARGTLDKPLTVVAQSFSVAAVKMIVLTGGTVILAEESPERRKNK